MIKKPKIIYDKETHEYRRASDGKLFAGVSTVAGMLPKPFLMPWAAKMCAEYVSANWKPGTAYDRAHIDETLKAAKAEHTKKKTDAATIGTDIHALLEEHVNSRISGEKYTLPTDDKIIIGWYNEFLTWEIEHTVGWLHSELLVADMDAEYAGRLDAVAMVDGVETIIDFKTSNQISDDFALQTAGYLNAYRKMGGWATKRIIIRIPKTAERKVWKGKKVGYITEINKLEIHDVETDLAFDIETFLSLRNVYRWVNYAKNKTGEK